jgi:hypothetical protein
MLRDRRYLQIYRLQGSRLSQLPFLSLKYPRFGKESAAAQAGGRGGDYGFVSMSAFSHR